MHTHKRTVRILHWLETMIALVCVVVVMIGLYFFVAQLLGVVAEPAADIRLTVESLLSDLLILVVGVELAIMLIKHTPESLIEIMFFVVARKLIIKNDSGFELLLGVAALAGLFAIRKYLMQRQLAEG